MPDLIPSPSPIGTIPLDVTEAPRSRVNPGDIARSGAEMGRGLKEAGAGLMDLATPIAEAQAASDLQNQKVSLGPDGKVQVLNPARSLIFGRAGEAYGQAVQTGTVAQGAAVIDQQLTDIHQKHLGDPASQKIADQAFVQGLKGATGNPLVDAALMGRAGERAAQHEDSNLDFTTRVQLGNTERALTATIQGAQEDLRGMARAGIGPGDKHYDETMGTLQEAWNQRQSNPLLKQTPEQVDQEKKHFALGLTGEGLVGHIPQIVDAKGMIEAKRQVDEMLAQPMDAPTRNYLRFEANRILAEATPKWNEENQAFASKIDNVRMHLAQHPEDANNPDIQQMVRMGRERGYQQEPQLEALVANAPFMKSLARMTPAQQDSALGVTPGASTPDAGPNLGTVTKALNLTPQEQHLYQHHLDNLTGPGGITLDSGARETVKQTTVEVDGKTYNIPTVWDGKELSGKDALARAKQEGIEKFPSYKDEDTAEARYGQMHKFMDKDVQATNAGAAPDGTPATKAGFTPGAPVTAIPGRPGQYSQSSMEQLARNAGFDEAGAKTMAAIAMGESGGFAGAKNTKNKDGSIDYGLTQINTVHGAQYAQAALDPQEAFKKAFELSKGGKDFSPWVQYQTGGYKRFVGTGGGAADTTGPRWTDAQVRANPWLNASIFQKDNQDPAERRSYFNAIVGQQSSSMNYGGLPSPEQDAAIKSMFADHKDDPSWQETMSKYEGQRDANLAEKLTPQERQQWDSSAGMAASQMGGDPMTKERAAEYQHFREENDKQWKAAPIAQAAKTGMADPGAASPLDMTSPQGMQQGIAAKAQAASAILGQRGEAVSVFEGADLGAVKGVLQNGTMPQKQALLDGMSAITDPHILNATMAKLGNDQAGGSFKIAAVLMDQNQPAAAQDVLDGQQILAGDKTYAPKESSTAGIRFGLGKALPSSDFGDEDSRGSVEAAVRAVYAKKSFGANDTTQDFDQTRFDESLQEVTGGVHDFRGSKVFGQRYGATDDDLDKGVRSLTDGDLANARAPNGEGVPAASLNGGTHSASWWNPFATTGDWRLESRGRPGDGSYYVYAGTGQKSYLRDATSGGKFVLDMSKK